MEIKIGRVSCGIHDDLTFGSGALDDNGYWEKPCAICARAWENLYPEDKPCWPFEPETAEQDFVI